MDWIKMIPDSLRRENTRWTLERGGFKGLYMVVDRLSYQLVNY